MTIPSKAVVFLVASLLAFGASDDNIGARTHGNDTDARVIIDVAKTTPSKTDQQAEGGKPLDVTVGARDRFQRHVMCRDWIVQTGGSAGDGAVSWQDDIPRCVEEFEITTEYCADGAAALPPLWRSPVIDPDVPTYGPWTMVSGYECAEDPLPDAIAQAWRQMKIQPQPVEVLPNKGWAIATMGVKPNLEDTPQTSTVNVLGNEVVLRATPTQTSWTVRDVITGDTWPGILETGSHGEKVLMFDRKEQRIQLELTTTWQGDYSLNGGSTWAPAPGTATTTSDPLSVHIYHPRARLVNCDTFGNCIDGGTSRNPFTLTDPDADGTNNYEVPDDRIGAYLKSRRK